MQWDTQIVKRIITTIGFVPQNGKNGIYRKTYTPHGGYSIFVDINQGKIMYDADTNPGNSVIKVWDRGTSNFSKSENFVILECVDRLLEKGYAPSCIELEKTYPSGRGHSGQLDIFVKCEDGTPFLMIECKTWGTEYKKEKNKMLKDGGQLFSYYSNDRDTKYLCLYTSRIFEDVEYKNVIIDVDTNWCSLSGVKEIFGHWNKNFKDNGIFDSYTTPYDIKHKALTYGKLKVLKEEDSGKIYNQIMEILRHNAISDKPNAFNKLLNLFVCKIIDEDKNADDELEFQWLETDTDESLQLRLNDLYKDGMWRFLEIDVIDYKQEDVTQKLDNLDADSDTKNWIMQMYTDTRLKKSPNFAFIEVQDDKTFSLNAKVIREIVELLQVFKFRYEQKHEFLGNFFELLLNTSMKQESGQFFTPVPITRFIISSLPLREFVQRRVDERNIESLPSVIDYACGSGHFLTEYMSQLQKIIDSDIDTKNAAPRVQKQFQAWQGFTKFTWAKDVIYGIDLDNRLVKTTKVSAFFNGDGEAEIIWANGLDHFTKSDSFRGKLKRSNGRDNGQFDILISNPPYSVESFKSIVNFGEESFELYPYLTDNSSEIECLFVERMKQLLKIGGWAAVILPSSILTNSGIHAKAREILLRYFYVKSIVELGSNTFMKTNTNTVILFLERRNSNDYITIQREINRFFTTKTDVTASGIENAFSTYVSNIYKDLTFTDYISLFSQTPTDSMKQHELYADYVKDLDKDFYAKAIEIEKEKMLYFLLTYNQNVVLIKTGKGKQEKQFLGYEFSERRGNEGLHWLPEGTKLYDETNPLNSCKANSYIYCAFLGKEVNIDDSMADNVFYGRLSGFIEYGTNKFNKVVNLGKTIQTDTKWPTIKVENLLSKIRGVQTKVPQKNILEKGEVPIISQDSSKLIIGYGNHITPITDLPLVLMGDHTCIFKYIDFPFACGSDNTRLIKFNDNLIIPKYGYYILSNTKIQNQSRYERHFKYVRELHIPLPPLNIQQKIVEEMEALEAQSIQINTEILQHRQNIENIFHEIDAPKDSLIGRIVECNPSKALISDISDDTVISFLEMASVSNDGYIINAVDRPLGDVRKGSYTYFQENDILIAKITPCMENGKCALATGLTNGIGMGSSEFHVFRCSKQVLPRYLFGYLNRPVIRKDAEKVMTGKSGHRRVPISFYQQLQISLPPLNEQQRIINNINQHESEINCLKERLRVLETTKNTVLKKYL